MAGNTISITFKLDSDGKGFKDLANDAEGLKKIITSTISEAQQLNTGAINFAAIATGISQVQDSMGTLRDVLTDLTAGYNYAIEAETKLTTVMGQRMGATQKEIESIKELALAQREKGVIDDDVQLMGAQQIATFLSEAQSIETLLPAMNNLLAQQKGYSATGQDAVAIGNLMGKVMQGQVSALTRVGITFDEAEEKVLKYGTESERAAMLAQVITNNVGEMNAQLGATDVGKQVQLEAKLGDVQDKLGELVSGTLPFVNMAAEATKAVGSVATLVTGIKTLSTTVYAGAKAWAVSTGAMIKNKVAALATAAAQKAVTAATTIWTGVQKILNLVLTMNPIGLIITAIGALVTAIIAAYNNCEGFRQIVDKVWEAIKPLANAIMNGLAKAFEWLVEKCKEAWEWLKNILGLGGKKVEVAVEVSKPKAAPAIDLGETERKYANYTPPKTPATPKTPSVGAGAQNTAPVWRENAATLEQIEENIDVLNEKLKKATASEAGEINKQIAHWQAKADAIKDAGKAVEDNTPIWKEDATTLKDITTNIQILQEKLENASVEEAATINQQIAAWNEKADAIKNAGKAVEDNTPKYRAQATTLKDINENIQVLQERLQTASIDEAAALNREIKLWNEKADAIKKAGIEAQTSGERNWNAFTTAWGAAKKLESSITSITDALKGNGSAWQIVCGIIDGFIGLYEGIQTVIGIINLLSAASAAHAATKGVEAGAETTEAATRATAATTNAAAATATVVANKIEAASWKELAAAKYMAAHASIPFAGYGIAAGFVAAMIATVTAAGIPALAEGGVASGPTLALVGEYAGAGSNPEVIAPLDKLRSMIQPAAAVDFSQVEFKIKGADLVGVINRRTNQVKRT